MDSLCIDFRCEDAGAVLECLMLYVIERVWHANALRLAATDDAKAQSDRDVSQDDRHWIPLDLVAYSGVQISSFGQLRVQALHQLLRYPFALLSISSKRCTGDVRTNLKQTRYPGNVHA